MPEPDYAWLPKDTLLTFEEIGDHRRRLLRSRRRSRAADRRRAAPAARPDVARRARWPARPAIRDLALTTNGVLLAAQAQALRDAGLHRITVSLDTLDRERFRRPDAVRQPRRASSRASTRRPTPGSTSLKIDTVVMRGVNDHELAATHRLRPAARRGGPLHRVHGRRRRDALVTRAPSSRAARCSTRSRGTTARSPRSTSSPRRRRIASRCRTARSSASSRRRPSRSARACDRSRLTADGVWLMCLYAQRRHRPAAAAARRRDAPRSSAT